MFPGKASWRLRTLMRVFAVAALLFLAPGAVRSAGLDGLIEFRSTLAPESTLKIVLGQWSQSERDKVLGLFESLHKKAPGLLARAAQAGPIMLYKTSTPTPSHPAAAWARRRHESSLIFRNDFFRRGGRNHLGVDYAAWLFVHELAHLADPVDRIGQSREWSALVVPRISTLEKKLSADRLSVRDAMFKRLDGPALKLGFPSVYAAMSQHEALAEYAAAFFFQTSFVLPGDVTRFLEARLFSVPSPEEGVPTRLYRQAYLLYRQKKYAPAAAALTTGLEKDPAFGMGFYLRGYVHVHMGRLREADDDWSRAQSLIPASDRRVTAELQQGRAFIRARLKN